MENNNKNEVEVKEEKTKQTDPKTLITVLVYAIIVFAIVFTHQVLEWFGVNGDKPWVVINAISFVGEIVVGLLALKYFLSVSLKKKEENLVLFIINIAVMAVAAIYATIYGINFIRNLVGAIKG